MNNRCLKIRWNSTGNQWSDFTFRIMWVCFLVSVTVRASVFVAVKAEVVGDDTVRYDRNENDSRWVHRHFLSVSELVMYLSERVVFSIWNAECWPIDPEKRVHYFTIVYTQLDIFKLGSLAYYPRKGTQILRSIWNLAINYYSVGQPLTWNTSSSVMLRSTSHHTLKSAMLRESALR